MEASPGAVPAVPRRDGLASRAEPQESALIGMHGSLTQDEQLVPLLTLTTV